MRTSYYKWLLLFLAGIPCFLYGQDTLVLTPSLEKNAKLLGPLLVSTDEPVPFSLEQLRNFKTQEDDRSFFYLDYAVTQAYMPFTVVNPSENAQELVLVFSFPFLGNIQLFKAKNDTLVPEGQVGLKSEKKPSERLWKIPFAVPPKETANYLIGFIHTPGKPLATDITLYSAENQGRVAGFQNTLIGTYFGLTVLSILFAFFIFGLTRYPVFILYGIYLMVLAVFMGSYLGYLNILMPFSKLHLSRPIYVASIELSTIVFVLFAQQVLQAKKYLPKLKRAVDTIAVSLIVLRIVLHFFLQSIYQGHIAFFMQLWFVTILFLLVAIVVELIVFLRHNRRIGSYFALSYLFMLLGSVLLILHHSLGSFKINLYGLPHLLFASMVEIVLLSITIALIVGKIYEDRNALANTLVLQQQKFLNAFVQGQEEERKRLGAELHDNIGSRLAHLKRLFSASYSDKNIQQEFDHVSEQIRDMAHSITPSEIALVGLPEALDELLEAVGQTEALEVNFNTFQFPRKLDEGIATHLFRIVQELVQNVVKHANARSINVQLFGHENSITLSFEDDGRGMDPTQKPKGLGLRSIKSRVAQINGQFLLDTSLNRGTSVLVIIPT